MRARKTTTIHTLDAAHVADYAAVLCDLDGCLVAGGLPLPGAEDFVHACASTLSIVSNNSADTGVTLSRHLRSIGLPVPPERIFLAGELAVRTIAAERPGARVAVFAEPPLRQLAGGLGLEQPEDRADVVLLARDTQFTLASLERALRLIEQGADLVVTNPDLSHPNAQGRPVPETGALLAAFRACCPDLAPRVFGKPEPFLIHEALTASGVSAAQAVFVGDNPATDGAAAALAGLDFLHLAPAGQPLAAGASSQPAGHSHANGARPASLEVTPC